MICELQIKNFFCPFGIFWYKFLSYIEVLHVLSELSKLLELSELIELPEVFCSMKKCLFHGALRLGDPLIKLLELRFVSLSSETSRSFQTSQSSQSSITSHPAFPDVVSHHIPLSISLSDGLATHLPVLMSREKLCPLITASTKHSWPRSSLPSVVSSLLYFVCHDTSRSTCITELTLIPWLP